MSILAERFVTMRAGGCCGFIPFIVAGDPDLKTSAKLLSALSKLDPVAIELGVPFSDPTADGPVIQRATQRSLLNGTTLEKILQTLRRQPRAQLAPIVLFSYYNPIFQFGLEEFAKQTAACGVAGVLVVDLPAEAAAPLRRALKPRGIDLIFLVAPTTSDRRLRSIAQLASGFIYVVARTGLTGAAREIEDESRQLVGRVRAVTDLPVAVGFGISDRRKARHVCRYADAAVVGSRLVAEIEQAASAGPASRVIGAVMQCASTFVLKRDR